jgi:glycosyltransferase involved in cell wall biosynthesis
MSPRVSVICTVLNEAAAIEDLVRSLSDQTRRPNEVIIADGGSTDGTLQALERFQQREAGRLSLTVLRTPGANIAQGRNRAIAASGGDVIAVVDAGVRMGADWLDHLVRPFEEDSPPDVVSGFFRADPRSPFETALGAVTLPRLDDLDPDTFNPSSRSVAFRREAWQRVGGYPEWLDYCEDLAFDLALRDAGCRFVFAPEALVHFRPRQTVGAFYRQYYRYARGDGKANLWLFRHLARYGTYLTIGPLLVALALLHHPLWWAGVAAGLGLLARTPLRRLRPWLNEASVGQRLALSAWAPVLRVVGDVAKMHGYPVGVWWRWRNAPQTPWQRRWR